ncbi:M23 family metallopeptidase [Microbacterium deminutum]|uniref:M23ase beta-sheet core domain-containing protein n=1 Tax=Microbacterium deminutum TaxID=344164 RepID=A0ABP5CK19_9MICO
MPHLRAPTWGTVVRSGAAFAVVLALVGVIAPAADAADRRPVSDAGRAAEPLSDRGWSWPVPGFRLERGYQAPPHRYGAGHRGIDLRPPSNLEVRAPAAGVVAFSGAVADRGILTIDHGSGLVSTLEPIESSLEAGAVVRRGEVVGEIAVGGHTAPGALHFGVRLHGEYINPMLLLGGIPRAVLLPCC